MTGNHNPILFLHGLNSSSKGTKGRYFRDHFLNVLCPDFSGDLNQRLSQLEDQCRSLSSLTLIGSSFGGLMATCFAIHHPQQVSRIILLAPALNFSEFKPPNSKIAIPTLLVMGANDTVCPPALVQPLAEKTFADIEIRINNDDHLLRKMFKKMAWQKMLAGERKKQD